jgi:hypothetical protein
MIAAGVLYATPASAAIAPTLSSVSITPTSVVGGSPATGAVFLTAPAPSGGMSIGLSSSNTAAATVPANVTVPAGATSATFAIDTNPVDFNPNVMPPGVGVTITASYRNFDLTLTRPTSKTASLTVLTPLVKNVWAWGPITGGHETLGLVEISGPAPAAGTLVTLSSANVGVATVSASVIVPAGEIMASFEINAKPVSTDTTVNISANRNLFDKKSASLTVLEPELSILACGEPSYSQCHGKGGTTIPARVWLDGPVAGTDAVVVNLVSSNPAAAAVPPTVILHAGQYKLDFGITAKPVPMATPVTITASYLGVSKQITVVVTTEHTWRLLALIYRDVDVNYSWQGEQHHFVSHMTDADVQRARAVLGTLQGRVNSWSTGYGDVYVQRIVEPTRKITSLSPYKDKGFKVAPDDIRADLDQYAPDGSYDSIIVLWRNDDDAGHTVPTGYWGLANAPSSNANGAGYAIITIPPNHGVWWEYYPDEVLVHEWLHQVTGYFMNRGYRMPNPDDAEDYGYSADANGSWRPYYSDIMRGRVWDGSRYIGLTQAIWDSAKPTDD